MKRMPPILLALVMLLSACKGAAPEAAATPTAAGAAVPTGTPGPLFTRADFPRLDGSTATAPLGRAVAARLLGESEEAVAGLIHFSKTSASYLNLMGGGADLLISAAPDQTALSTKEQVGYEWEMAPFANDAFVFLVNEDNPVNSLTVEELRDIYTGKITNWSQVGGEDAPITAFQRNQGAGSQTLMENLVMQGAPMADAPGDYVVESMGGLMEAVRSFDGTASAIGYSVYYYAEEMRMAGGLKLLRVEGVEPTPETIRAGEYPLLSPYYAVIPALAAEGSGARRLFDWLLSDEGQALVAQCGYVSVRDTAGYRPPEGGEAGETVQSRWYPQETGTLLPLAEGYGPLVPFSGGAPVERVDWEDGGHRRVGLMTTGGKIVVDCVFFGAGRLVYYDEFNRQQALPLLRLTEAVREEREDGDSRGAYRYAVADSEGRWCTGFDYTDVYAAPEGILLGGGGGIALMDTAGSITREWTWAELGFAPGERAIWYNDEPAPWSCGMVRLANEYREDAWYQRYLNTETGKLLEFTGGSAWSRWTDDMLYYGTHGEGSARYFDKKGKLAFSLDARQSDGFLGGRVSVKPDEDTARLLNKTGAVLLEVEGPEVALQALPDGDGSWWYLAQVRQGDGWAATAAWDAKLRPVEVPADAVPAGPDGWAVDQSGGFWRAGEHVTPPASLRSGGWTCDWVQSGVAGYSGSGGGCAVYRLSDWRCLANGDYYYLYPRQDELTGEVYLLCRSSDETDPNLRWEKSRSTLVDLDGKTLYAGAEGEEVRLVGGLIEIVSGSAVRLTARDGTVLYQKRDYPEKWED